MSLVICPHLHRNSQGGVWKNCFCFGDSTVEKVSNSSPSRRREIASPPIPNSIFFWGREGPGLPVKLVRTALAKGFRYPSPTLIQTPDFVTGLFDVCRHVSHLETCAKDNVRAARCGDRAAHLMSMLVNVSADLSYKCSGRHRHHGSTVSIVHTRCFFTFSKQLTTGR